MTTTTIYGDLSDGHIQNIDGEYTAITSNATMEIGSQSDGDYFLWEHEGFLRFDTSEIPDGDTITAADLSLYYHGSAGGQINVSQTAEIRLLAWGPTLTTADWYTPGNLGNLTLVASRSMPSNESTGAYKTFTDVALAANISKTGWTELIFATNTLRTSDFFNHEGCWSFASSDASGTTNDPKITITHSGGAANLTVANASHGHTAANIALTQVHQLVVANAAHADTASNVALGVAIVVQNSGHSHSASNVALTPGGLVVQNSSHAHSATSPDLDSPINGQAAIAAVSAISASGTVAVPGARYLTFFAESLALSALFSGTKYVKLHLGDPGENGTASPATITTRIGSTFSSPSGGATRNDQELVWRNVPVPETYSHFSIWDAASGGNCLGVGIFTPSQVISAGQRLRIAPGDLAVSMH